MHEIILIPIHEMDNEIDKNNINNYVKIENLWLSLVYDVYPCCVFMDVCSVISLFCLFTYVCVCL